MKIFKVKIWMRQSKAKFDFEFSQYPKTSNSPSLTINSIMDNEI